MSQKLSTVRKGRDRWDIIYCWESIIRHEMYQSSLFYQCLVDIYQSLAKNLRLEMCWWNWICSKGYCNFDYAWNRDNRKSKLGYVINLYGSVISWKSNLQFVALSTTETKYNSHCEIERRHVAERDHTGNQCYFMVLKMEFLLQHIKSRKIIELRTCSLGDYCDINKACTSFSHERRSIQSKQTT